MVQAQNPQHAVALPAVDRVLRLPAVQALVAQYGHTTVVHVVRALLSDMRQEILDGAELPAEATCEPALARGIRQRLDTTMQPSLRRVFNLTGTVLHTNLGRAPLPDEAVAAVQAAMVQPCNLEYDLDRGGRGDRDVHVEALLCKLTGAEAAIVVNNNAAAVLLTLNTLALRKEVIVSRSELIEIGGSFRIPEIMARAGCRLHEVGTTNCTHLADFEKAINGRTSMLFKVHASNFAIVGFTAGVSEEELGVLAHSHGLAFGVDLGSGTLVDLGLHGLPHEPTPQDSLNSGADLVTFSGDKLLGGPQCGIIVGRTELVARIKRNHLRRALRVDKMTVAALEAVLRLYRQPETLVQRLPVLRLLTRPLDDIDRLCKRVAPAVARAVASAAEVGIVPCDSQIGSGALPLERLPSQALALTPLKRGRGEGAALKRLAEAFRALPVPVIGAVSEGALRFDLRCLENEREFVEQLGQLRLGGGGVET